MLVRNGHWDMRVSKTELASTTELWVQEARHGLSLPTASDLSIGKYFGEWRGTIGGEREKGELDKKV